MMSPEFMREYYLNRMARSNICEERREKKLRELEEIDNLIKRVQEHCGHDMIVNLGYEQLDRNIESKCRCLICGKVIDGKSLDESKYIIYAENYLPQYDITDKEQCKHKFNLIKTLAYGLWKEKTYASEEEFVNELNNIIQESVLLKKEQSSPVKRMFPQKNKIYLKYIL